MSIIGALPTVLIDEIRLETQKKEVFFPSIKDRVPPESKHILVEISAKSTLTSATKCCLRINDPDNPSGYHTATIFADQDVVGHSHLAAGESAKYFQGLDIPSRADDFGGGYILLPWCFLPDRYPTMLSFGFSPRSGINRSSGAGPKCEAVASLTITPLQGMFEVGTVFRLYAIDESHILDEININSNGEIRFENIESGYGSIFMLGSVRSTANGFEYARVHKGDRMYHHFNNVSSQQQYRFQRLTGEGTRVSKVLAFLDRFRRKIMRWLMLKSSVRPQSCIQDQAGSEKRFAWVPNAESEAGQYGVHAVFYPEYSNNCFFRSWMSLHGAKEGKWNPSANETGYWTNSERLRSLAVFPRGGPTALGVKAAAGSKEGLYRPKGKRQRFVVPPEGVGAPTFQVQPGGWSLNILVVGRSNALVTNDDLLLSFNDDTHDENYLQQQMSGHNGSHRGSRARSRRIGILAGTRSAAGMYGTTLITVPNYSALDRQKQIFSITGGYESAIGICCGKWQSADAIASVTISLLNGAFFEPGSVFEVWVTELGESPEA